MQKELNQIKTDLLDKLSEEEMTSMDFNKYLHSRLEPIAPEYNDRIGLIQIIEDKAEIRYAFGINNYYAHTGTLSRKTKSDVKKYDQLYEKLKEYVADVKYNDEFEKKVSEFFQNSDLERKVSIQASMEHQLQLEIDLQIRPAKIGKYTKKQIEAML